MLEIMYKGGPLMFPIILCSIIALAIFFEKIYHFHHAVINRETFMSGLRNIIKNGKITESISICSDTHGPVAATLKAGLLKHDKSKESIKEAMEETARYEIPRLERRLNILATVAHIAPLLGFLGTVTGMINAFMQIQEKAGLVNAADLAAGIWEALITTAAGLVVAIPAFVAYNYLTSRVKLFVEDMEQSASELLNILESREDRYL